MGRVITTILLLTISATATVTLMLMPAPAPTGGGRTRPDPRTVPCVTEDSVGCYWDAQHMGNGQGSSFWVDYDGTVHYQ